MGIAVFLPGERLQFDYLNHRDVLERRDVIFKGLDYGTNEWYPEPQWFMRCHDLARGADRSFALARLEGSAIVSVPNGLVAALDSLVGKPFELPLPFLDIMSHSWRDAERRKQLNPPAFTAPYGERADGTPKELDDLK